MTTLFSIFFISVSLFTYQIVLTRLYSTILSYHYVFLTTSFAILGLGIGSVFSYVRSIRAKSEGTNNPEKITKQINKASIVLAVSFIMVFALIYVFPLANSILAYIILGTVPFLIGGYLYSIIFKSFSEISGRLYFMDLIGSAAGSLAVIFFLNNIGMFRTIIVVCVIALLPSLMLSATTKKIRVAGCILPLILIAGLFLPGSLINSMETNFYGLLNNTGKTFGNVKKAGLSPEIVFSKWNAFSRTDVIKISENPDEMILTIDGSANAPMYKFDGDINNLDEFKTDTGYLPFSIGENKKTLLIGSGGGRDVLYALAGKSTDISAVEINTASIDAVKAFGEYNGSIYDRPEVKVYGEDGRGFIRRTSDKFDLIFLSLVMTNTSQGMGYALSENYIYTVEAMEDYLDHLGENGKIAFLAHDQSDLSKIVATAMQALENKGISLKDSPKHIALFTKYMPQEHGGAHLLNPVVIIKNKPFNEDESNELLSTALENGIVPMYTPLIYEQGVLHHIKEAHISMSDYINGFGINVTPATDDNPYFYNFNRGVPSTLLLILMVVVMGSIILFYPFAIKKGNFKPTIYFCLLGIGFMMIEVPLIQKFILYLGHPTLAFTYVLAALLIGCGLGGYMSSNKLFNRVVKVFYLPPVLVAVIDIILILSLSLIFEKTHFLSLAGRIVVASSIVMLQGFFMGMPFPRGLKLLGESGRSEVIAVMWGVNGVASVIGSVLSIIISMLFGFTGALIAGAVIYIAAGFYRKL